MEIIDRIKLNVKANLNYALDKAEDPQKMLNQFLLDMRESIREFKESIVNAIVGVKSLEQKIAANSGKIDLWGERAKLALEKGDENLARKALEQKQVCIENDDNYKKELSSQKQTVDELKASLSTLEAKLDELYQKRIELIKRIAQVQKETIQKPLVDQIGIDTSVFDNYDSLVEKVRTLEAQAEALSELTRGDEIEEKFKKMERESAIEAELKSMKGEQ